MKIRAKIALCTPGGPVGRGAEFEIDNAEMAQRWIDQGKAESVEVSPVPEKKATAATEPQGGK